MGRVRLSDFCVLTRRPRARASLLATRWLRSSPARARCSPRRPPQATTPGHADAPPPFPRRDRRTSRRRAPPLRPCDAIAARTPPRPSRSAPASARRAPGRLVDRRRGRRVVVRGRRGRELGVRGRHGRGQLAGGRGVEVRAPAHDPRHHPRDDGDRDQVPSEQPRAVQRVAGASRRAWTRRAAVRQRVHRRHQPDLRRRHRQGEQTVPSRRRRRAHRPARLGGVRDVRRARRRHRAHQLRAAHLQAVPASACFSAPCTASRRSV